MKKLLFLISFFCLPFAQSRNLETIVKEVHLDTDSRQLAQKKAVSEISVELIRAMLGEKRFQAEQEKIKKSIIKNQNRYILSIRSSKPELKDKGGFLSTVSVKVSKDNLKQLLLENNLFYQSQGSFCVLPVVSFVSYLKGEKKVWSWWKGHQNETALLEQAGVDFFDQLSQRLIQNSFYPLNPVFQKMYEGTPSVFLPKEGSRVRNFKPLAEFYTCDIILSGHIQFGEGSSVSSSLGLDSLVSFFRNTKKEVESSGFSQQFIHFFFHVFNIQTHRVLFKIEKQFALSSDFSNQLNQEMNIHLSHVLDSFIYQLSFYQDKGALELNRLMLSVQGPLTYLEKERLKKSLIQNTASLKNLEERFLTSSRIVYEAESSKGIKALTQELKQLSLPHFDIQVKGYKKNTVEIYAKIRAGR